MLQLIVRAGQIRHVITVEQAGPVALSDFQERADGLPERSQRGLLLAHGAQHLFIVLAHRLTAFVLVIREHMCRLVDQGIGLGERRPERLCFLQSPREQAVQFVQSRVKAPLFSATRASELAI